MKQTGSIHTPFRICSLRLINHIQAIHDQRKFWLWDTKPSCPLFSKTVHLTVDKTCSLLHYPRTKIHIQWGSWEDRKPAVVEIAGFAFVRRVTFKLAMPAADVLNIAAPAQSVWPIRISSFVWKKRTKKTRRPGQRVNPSFERLEETRRTINNFSN